MYFKFNLSNQNFENSISLIKNAQYFRLLSARNQENAWRANSFQLEHTRAHIATSLQQKRNHSWLSRRVEAEQWPRMRRVKN